MASDLSLIAGAEETVREWYKEDVGEYHRKSIDDKWWFEGRPDEHGFLTLLHDGSHNYIRFNPVPVALYGEHDESGEFRTPGYLERSNLPELLYRELSNPIDVAMSPEKMKKYGIETDFIRIDEGRGRARVLANVFSSCHASEAEAFVLRGIAVFYLNGLLEKAKEYQERALIASL